MSDLMPHYDIVKHLGAPYKLHGRDASGLDCWGFIMLVYREALGKELIDVDGYDEHWSWHGGNLFIENYSKQWEEVKEPRPYDIVFFKNGAGVANHCGIFIGANQFIHCCKAGVVIGRLTDKRWADRIQGYYRLK